ncbi:PHB depolymerase family esterase [uncultured Lamprocystis sp.]|jgi:poly(hydroxyalkanoate) depolymerase family esterase|uniref:extracellular catalytic domain type 1 short-chain-length polyhydroxyalkanoate depolymerase n=1 Tax=uncultured Lamprocystis sp. TaxID=543132 RepID=UPI0025E39A0B|nr:PHB depolymerase family esterase [uncultured Lamprocystis sp.]
MKINAKMLSGMREAMARLQRDGPAAATTSIQQTLFDLMPRGTPGERDPAPRGHGDAAGALGGFVPDLLARLGLSTPPDGSRFLRPAFAPQGAAQPDVDAPASGEFLAGGYTNQAGTRDYKIYIPSAYAGQALPLVVMLHGCTQGPDDCAVGTRWNAIAEEWPCLVLYPAQSSAANPTRCWNWFNADHQQRDIGEPSLIAGMTREVIANYHADPARIYIAGLSAGGTMAVTMGTLYPELYAAIGTHSGVPYAAASDLPSALGVMQSAGAPTATPAGAGTPIIVFHGDRDQTVHPRNSDHIMSQCVPPRTRAQTQTRQAEGAERTYTQTIHQGPDGAVVAEHWLVHGAGHAWFGGDRRGSFTDGTGPDASREMMRFFAAHAQPKAALATARNESEQG